MKNRYLKGLLKITKMNIISECVIILQPVIYIIMHFNELKLVWLIFERIHINQHPLKIQFFLRLMSIIFVN